MDDLVRPVSEVEFPAMRAEVLVALRSMASPEEQKRWIDPPPNPTRIENLDINVHILYDDCEVVPEPADSVGSILYEDEVPALRDFHAAFGPLLHELRNSPDEVYLADPRWPEVIRAARRALDVMLKHEQ